MTFTEVAFELADKRHPLCKLTGEPQEAYGVYRTLDHGIVTRRHRAHLVVRASRDLTVQLTRDLRDIHGEHAVELLDHGPTHASLTIEAPTDMIGPAALPRIGTTLSGTGLPALLDPIVAEQGKFRARILVPRRTEPHDVLRALQEVQRECGFAEFRILRIADVEPTSHVDGARRALPPEQEVLLALATSMGYYQTPKAVTLEDIAKAVGLSISPVHKRLKSAEETIVGQHVADSPSQRTRRRSRAAPLELGPSGPWEVELRMRGDFGPATFLASVPGARASIHVLSADGARAQASLMVVIAPAETQAKLLSSLEDRADVGNVEIVERSPQHFTARLTTQDRGPYALSWWCEAWGNDATLRSILYEEGEAHVRALVTRPMSTAHLMSRLETSARAAGGESWDLLSLRTCGDGVTPPSWPDALTQRQLEVLRVAHALGYYRTPRSCTLENVANTLGISANAVHKNLVHAEGKLIASYLASTL